MNPESKNGDKKNTIEINFRRVKFSILIER